MGSVTVTPETFSFVKFEAADIAEVARKAMDLVGLPADSDLRVEVDETSPLGRTAVAGVDPIVITAESGAFEDPKRPRLLNPTGVEDVLGRLLFRVKDRLGPGFADAPADDDLSVRQANVWDTYAVGRAARAGLATQRARRQYHFRSRHGFTDVADAEFERLWDADGLTWADLAAVVDRCATARDAAA
jgi:hypothetical protein